jgi:AcrR family transcriptional regulator
MDAKAAPIRRRRRTQEERSIETREKLLRATIEVLMERGYNGLSLAHRAGLSSGARVHHFRAKVDLVIAATAFAYEQAAESGRQLAERNRASADPLGAFIADSRTIYFNWPFMIALEVLVPARTDPALAAKITPIMDNYRQTMNAIWRDVLNQAGVPAARAEKLLDLTLNLIRGMAINSLWQNDPAHYDALIAEWHSLVGSLVADGRSPQSSK